MKKVERRGPPVQFTQKEIASLASSLLPSPFPQFSLLPCTRFHCSFFLFLLLIWFVLRKSRVSTAPPASGRCRKLEKNFTAAEVKVKKMRPEMLAARSLRKAAIPPSLLSDPSPANVQPTRLAVHVNGAGFSCSAYLASGCRVYKIEISMEGSMLSKGKESLLIPVNAQVISSAVVDRCPHRSEIQSVVLAEGEGDNCLILGTVDSYGHLIVSRLDAVADDIDRISYSVLPHDCGVGEGSWAGICFSPMHWSTVAVARGLCKSIDIYDQDIHLRSLRGNDYSSEA